MSIFTIAAVALSLATSVAAQRRGSRARRLAGGAIAGIAIACVVVGLLFCLCCCMLFRRRRGRTTGQPAPGMLGAGGGGRFGRIGRPFGRTGGGYGPGAQEAGYANGPGAQGGWNANAQPAYQPPAGAPPNAPQPGGFMAPPQAHTKPY